MGMKSHLIIRATFSARGCRRGNAAAFPPAQRSAEPGLVQPCPRAAATWRSTAITSKAVPRSGERSEKVLLPEQGCSARAGLQPVAPNKTLGGAEFYLQSIRSFAFPPGSLVLGASRWRFILPLSSWADAPRLLRRLRQDDVHISGPGRCREMPREPPVTHDLPCCPHEAKQHRQPAAMLQTDSESIISSALISTHY